MAKRSTRATAGNRLQQLLANEVDDDEFYSQELFKEEENDDEFEYSGEEVDYVDSDFDVDEIQEEEQSTEPSEEPLQKQRRAAYVDPKVVPRKQRQAVKKTLVVIEKEEDEEEELLEPSATSFDTPVKTPHRRLISAKGDLRKSLRRTTLQSTINAEQNWRKYEERKKVAKPKVMQYRRLTQEELLEEAKSTAELNLASLDAFRRREEEKKKVLKKTPVIVGPRIVFHSKTVVKDNDPFFTTLHYKAGSRSVSAFHPISDTGKVLKRKNLMSSSPSPASNLVIPGNFTPVPFAHLPVRPVNPSTPSPDCPIVVTNDTPSSPTATIESSHLQSDAAIPSTPETTTATSQQQPNTTPQPAIFLNDTTVDSDAAEKTPSTASQSPIVFIEASTPPASSSSLEIPSLCLTSPPSSKGAGVSHATRIATGALQPKSVLETLDLDKSKHKKAKTLEFQERLVVPEPPAGPYGRQFINFYNFDEQMLPQAVTLTKIPYAPKITCVITGLPAKYLDPRTQLPYANVHAFKMIRQLYG